jgi:Zn finger protein HypA/HybF involved in hydrogenase expression
MAEKDNKTTIFIEKAINKHKDKYEYNKTYYTGNKNKVIITCKKHGDFNQIATNHLQGKGCPVCAKMDKRMSSNEFVSRSIKKYGNAFDYTHMVFKDTKTKVKLRCIKHDLTFEQLPSNHFKQNGCPSCYSENLKKSKTYGYKNFVKRANRIHGGKYTYFKDSFINLNNDTIIKCDKHGLFTQRPMHHLGGSGCPKCKGSRGELKISRFLDRNKISYIREFMLPGSKLRYDFYLPDLNIIIEYDGIQHFKPIEAWGGLKRFLNTVENDKLKTYIAGVLSVDIIRITYHNYDNIDMTLDKELNKIFKYKVGGKYFRTFLELARYYKLPDEATINNYKSYLKEHYGNNLPARR